MCKSVFRVFLVVFFCACVRVSAQTTSWTGDGADTNWNNSDNWDNGVPTPASQVVIDINGGRPVLTDDVVISSLFGLSPSTTLPNTAVIMQGHTLSMATLDVEKFEFRDGIAIIRENGSGTWNRTITTSGAVIQNYGELTVVNPDQSTSIDVVNKSGGVLRIEGFIRSFANTGGEGSILNETGGLVEMPARGRVSQTPFSNFGTVIIEPNTCNPSDSDNDCAKLTRLRNEKGGVFQTLGDVIIFDKVDNFGTIVNDATMSGNQSQNNDFEIIQGETGSVINNGSIENSLESGASLMGGTISGSGPYDFSIIETTVSPDGAISFSRHLDPKPTFSSLSGTVFDLEPGVDSIEISGELECLELRGTINIVGEPEPGVYDLISYVPAAGGLSKINELQIGTVPDGLQAELVDGADAIQVMLKSGTHCPTTTWTGAGADPNWNNADNWDNGVPTPASHVVIENLPRPVLTEDVVICSLFGLAPNTLATRGVIMEGNSLSLETLTAEKFEFRGGVVIIRENGTGSSWNRSITTSGAVIHNFGELTADSPPNSPTSIDVENKSGGVFRVEGLLRSGGNGGSPGSLINEAGGLVQVASRIEIDFHNFGTTVVEGGRIDDIQNEEGGVLRNDGVLITRNITNYSLIVNNGTMMDGFANLDDFDVFQSEKGVFINNGSVEQLLDLHVEFVGGTLIGSGPCEFSRIGTRVVPNGVLQFKRAFISNPCCNEFISLAQTEFDLEPGVDQLSITGNLGRLQLEGTVNIVSNPEPDVCLLYTSPSPRDLSTSRMPSSA